MTNGEGDAEPDPAETSEEIGAKDAKPLNEIPPEDKKALEGAEQKTLIQLKDYYGKWVLRIMAGQLVVVNAVFLASLGSDGSGTHRMGWFKSGWSERSCRSSASSSGSLVRCSRAGVTASSETDRPVGPLKHNGHHEQAVH